MINRVVLVGRLTKDPELRQTGTGIAVATFSLAVNRTFTSQSGEREADFVPIVVWRKQAENVAQYIGKGSLVGVEGRLQTRTYEAQDGGTRFIMEVVADSVQFLEPRGASANRQQNNYGGGQQYSNNNNNAGNFGGATAQPQQQQQQQPANQNVDFSFENDNSFDISDDDLPF